jgi:hypothetical protein
MWENGDAGREKKGKGSPGAIKPLRSLPLGMFLKISGMKSSRMDR